MTEPTPEHYEAWQKEKDKEHKSIPMQLIGIPDMKKRIFNGYYSPFSREIECLIDGYEMIEKERDTLKKQLEVAIDAMECSLKADYKSTMRYVLITALEKIDSLEEPIKMRVKK